MCMRVVKKDNARGAGDVVKFFRSTADQNNVNLKSKGRPERSFAENKVNKDGTDGLVSPFAPYSWFESFIIKLTNMALTEDVTDRIAGEMKRTLEKLKDESTSTLAAALQTFIRELPAEEAIAKWYDC